MSLTLNPTHLSALVDLAKDAGNTDFLVTLRAAAKDALEGDSSKTLTSFGQGSQTFAWMVQYSALDMYALVNAAIRQYNASLEDTAPPGSRNTSFASWQNIPL